MRARHIPIFWNCPSPEPTKDAYLKTIEELGIWLYQYPEIPCVLTNGFPFDYFSSEKKVAFPEEFWHTMSAPNLLVELCFPIIMGGRLHYPYHDLWPIVQQFYEKLGAKKLVWGSDMPNVERFCTYSQCLNYLRDYCPFIPKEDMKLICGDNLLTLFANTTELLGPTT